MVLIKECIAAAKVSHKKAMRYSHEWLLLCLLMHIRSSNSYDFLRDNNILPLPAKSTITHYLKASNTGVGFDDEFFNMFAKELKVR